MSAIIALEEAQLDEQLPVKRFSSKVVGAVALIAATALVASGGAAAAWHVAGATTASAPGGRRLLSESEALAAVGAAQPPVAILTFPTAQLQAIAPEPPRTLLDGECSNDGEDCRATQCCTNTDSTCFRKNDHWASCNASCTNSYKWWNNGWVDQGEEHIWDCHTLSCSEDGQNCMSSRCCANPSSKCFRKNERWASCNASCSQNFKWESTGWVDKGEQIWDCVELLPKQECDMAVCDRCSGEQCQYCRELQARDCCLDDACRGARGEQVAQCHRDQLETCCQGKSEQCKGGTPAAPAPAPAPVLTPAPAAASTPAPASNLLPCDTSSCDEGCSGEGCEACREFLERNCCLEAICQGTNEAMCFTHNLEKCCAGKSSRCIHQHGPTPISTRTVIFKQ